MDKSKSNLKIVPFALIGLILVLGFMVFYSKLNKSKTSYIAPSPKITVTNEFSQISNTQTASNTPATENKFPFQVTSPANKSVVKSAQVTVKGKTAANAEIYLNEIDSKADANGNFSVNYTLDEGENYLVVGANDENGNNSEVELDITYAP
jgi:outer membrane lipoprotein-sorting protein